MFQNALKGIRVADFSWIWAGPYAASLLAYMGAEVIKIESRSRIDQTRKGTIMDTDNFDGLNYSPTFNNANLNKKGVSLDISTPEGSTLAKKIVAECDIVISNMRPGKMEKSKARHYYDRVIWFWRYGSIQGLRGIRTDFRVLRRSRLCDGI